MTSKRPLKRKAPTVGELVADLRRRHESGEKLAKRFCVTDKGETSRSTLKRAKYAARGQEKFKKLAAKEGVPPTELFSRRRFAVLYTKQDLNRLCNRRTPEGRPLSWAIIKWLLRVEDDGDREELERRVAEEGWTVDDLRAELRLRTKTPHVAGRSVRTPKSLEAGLVTIATESNRLINLLEAYIIGDDSTLSTVEIPEEDDDAGRQFLAINLAKEKLREVRKQALKAFKKLGQFQDHINQNRGR